MRRAPILLAFLLAVVASAVSTSLSAQARTPASEAVAREAIAKVRSPYCPGLMLEVCPSPRAELLRDSIHALAAKGVPARDIVEDVLARHGEEWRAIPKRSGAGFWAWLLPPLALVGGAALVAMKLRSLQRKQAWAPEPAADAAVSDDDRARLDAALADWERTEASR